MRKIVIELQIDWEGYEDVSDDLIVEDAIEAKADGVSWKIANQRPANGYLSLSDLSTKLQSMRLYKNDVEAMGQLKSYGYTQCINDLLEWVQSKRNDEFALSWWTSLTFEEQFFKTIEWLKSQNRNVTERHPHKLSIDEIYQIYLMHKNKIRSGTDSFVAGDKVIFIPENKIYEFGYMGQDGKAIIYEEGERNMQDSYAVDLHELRLCDITEHVCDNCEPISGFYLGTTCPKCGKSFRSEK